MADKNNNKANEEVKNEPVQQQNDVPAPEPTPAPQQTAEEQKGGFGTWVKRHWKGLVAGATATAAAVGSAVVAYKKGKAAGQCCVPVQQTEPEDYSLNPNE